MGKLKRYNRDARLTETVRIHKGWHWDMLYAVLRFFNAKLIGRWVFRKPRLQYLIIRKDRVGKITVEQTYIHIKDKSQLLIETFTTDRIPS